MSRPVARLVLAFALSLGCLPELHSADSPPPTPKKPVTDVYLGVKIVDDVDKKSFTAIADPYLDKLAKELGPHAEKIKNLIRAIN